MNRVSDRGIRVSTVGRQEGKQGHHGTANGLCMPLLQAQSTFFTLYSDQLLYTSTAFDF